MINFLKIIWFVVFVSIISSLNACSEQKKETSTPIENEDPATDLKDSLRSIKYGQYNIEFANKKSSTIPWSERRGLVKKIFDKYDFDIVTIDEAFYPQLDDMLDMMPEYAYYGSTVKGDENTKNLTVGMMYKSDRFEIKKSGKFWLSATPFELSKAFGGYGNKNRICNWAFFEDKKHGVEFYVFATHIEVGGTGEENQWKQVSVILDQIKSIAGDYPVFLSGDFNFNQNSSNYAKIINGGLLVDSYSTAEKNRSPNQSTFNGYDIDRRSDSRIDHVFLTKCADFKVKSYSIITDHFSGKFPSDHFPILIDVDIPHRCK